RSRPIRLIVVSDDPSVREVARQASGSPKEGIQLVGVFRSAIDALKRLNHLKPDVALVGASLGETDGLICAQNIRNHNSQMVVLLVGDVSAGFSSEAALLAG